MYRPAVSGHGGGGLGHDGYYYPYYYSFPW